MLGLSSLPHLRDYRSRRSSSFDREGNNSDWWTFEPGDERAILETDKPGCIRHIWITVGNGGEHFLRKLVLRAWWDGEATPSIEVPLGDFFGIGHGVFKNFISAPLQMSPQEGRAMNCWWPMPFDRARVTLHSECDEKANVYFYVDYEEYSAETVELAHVTSTTLLPSSSGAGGGGIGRFHAQWRRENPTDGWLTERLSGDNVWEVWSRKPNVTGDDNYVILDTTGSGIYVGCNLNIDCFNRQGNDWYGEGDDMIFIDGERWPPGLHGTGTEDYFNMAFCPREEYCAPFHGLTMYSGNKDWNWKGKNSMYRYHIEDPIRFHKSILVTIEHGHANKLWNDYSSTAYWYQLEPHGVLPKLLPVGARLPRSNEPDMRQA